MTRGSGGLIFAGHQIDDVSYEGANYQTPSGFGYF
jgi:hypothetical protein